MSLEYIKRIGDCSMLELLRIIVGGKDNKGYTYTASQRLRALLGVLAVLLVIVSFYAALRRAFETQINEMLPDQVLSVEMEARIAVRHFFEVLIQGLHVLLTHMLENAWLSLAVFLSTLLLLIAWGRSK